VSRLTATTRSLMSALFDLENVEVEIVGNFYPGRPGSHIDPPDAPEFDPTEAWVVYPSNTHPKEQKRVRADWLLDLTNPEEWLDLAYDIETGELEACYHEDESHRGDE